MGGAILVGFFAFAVAKKRTTNFLGGALHLPQSTEIDKHLIWGNVMFGMGWGLAGFCPGPALVSMAAGQDKALVFVLSMIFGMIAYELIQRRKTS
jgi:uncharacterized membrane protein YedE/YeeE